MTHTLTCVVVFLDLGGAIFVQFQSPRRIVDQEPVSYVQVINYLWCSPFCIYGHMHLPHRTGRTGYHPSHCKKQVPVCSDIMYVLCRSTDNSSRIPSPITDLNFHMLLRSSRWFWTVEITICAGRVALQVVGP